MCLVPKLSMNDDSAERTTSSRRPSSRASDTRVERKWLSRLQDCVKTLNFHCKCYHDVAAGQSVQLSHRGLSYSLPRLASSAVASDLTPTNGGVS
jgi:hypothetical protein